jgi:hypothetical protein
MKKIPTIFERDWEGDRSRVLKKPSPGCEWVFAGEGNALRKYDGTAVLVDENGDLFKRLELRGGKAPPVGFRQVDDDMNTGKVIGWVPVGFGPEDKWYLDALPSVVANFDRGGHVSTELDEGTYELVGPKIQGNPEKFNQHTLVRHSFGEGIGNLDRTFEGLRRALEELDWEGIVFHHPDGRMAKIKGRDFGLKRGG